MLASIQNLAKFRKGMTLVELLIAMSIMVMMAAITAAFYPSISSDNQISKAANQVQSFLVGARQKARRDKVSYGVRLLPSDSTNSASSDLIYIQKPGDLIKGGAYTIVNILPHSNPLLKIVVFNQQVWFPLVGTGKEEDIVTTGDTLIINPNHKSTVFYLDNTLPNSQLCLDNNLMPNVSSELFDSSKTWKIARQGRIVPGEQSVNLPEGYEISLVSFDQLNPIIPCSVLPLAINNSIFDILFDPSGAIANRDVGNDLYLWIHKKNSTDLISDDAIITIKKSTGRVGVFPVGPNNNPYLFSADPSNEGI